MVLVVRVLCNSFIGIDMLEPAGLLSNGYRITTDECTCGTYRIVCVQVAG